MRRISFRCFRKFVDTFEQFHPVRLYNNKEIAP